MLGNRQIFTFVFFISTNQLGLIGEYLRNENHRAIKAFHISAFVFICFWLADFITAAAYGVVLFGIRAELFHASMKQKVFQFHLSTMLERKPLAEKPKEAIV